MTRGWTILRNTIAAVALIAVASCTTIYRNHGYTPSEDELAELIVGVDTRDSVIDVLGRPSSGGVLNDTGAYYVSSRFRHFAYQEPRAVERLLVAVTFDEVGVVENIERFTLEDGNVVPLSRRVTDTNIRGVTFIRQLLGNFGNLDAGNFLGRSN
ncbi:outer membrane protein assembly factor BamE [Algirhabdus cladophorae]|uniref:outer membrane protein assembly factor BamE n=1 Tax=Algirhabdus cladophorae TaxID=3377108 RepID=UPI003B848851